MSPQAGFLLLNEVVPRLKSAIPHAVRVVGAEDHEELLQDATAMAAKLLHSAEAAGKKVTPGNIAYFTIQNLKSGRRSTGSSCVDVMQPGTQLNGHTQLVSLEETVHMDVVGNETLTLGDVLSNDREDPGIIATRRLDWSSFCETQPARNQAILKCIAAGEPLTQVAQRHRVSRSGLQANKNALAHEIRQFMGQDILEQTSRLPVWKHNLALNRGSSASRKDAKEVGAVT